MYVLQSSLFFGFVEAFFFFPFFFAGYLCAVGTDKKIWHQSAGLGKGMRVADPVNSRDWGRACQLPQCFDGGSIRIRYFCLQRFHQRAVGSLQTQQIGPWDCSGCFEATRFAFCNCIILGGGKKEKKKRLVRVMVDWYIGRNQERFLLACALFPNCVFIMSSSLGVYLSVWRGILHHLWVVS